MVITSSNGHRVESVKSIETALGLCYSCVNYHVLCNVSSDPVHSFLIENLKISAHEWLSWNGELVYSFSREKRKKTSASDNADIAYRLATKH